MKVFPLQHSVFGGGILKVSSIGPRQYPSSDEFFVVFDGSRYRDVTNATLQAEVIQAIIPAHPHAEPVGLSVIVKHVDGSAEYLLTGVTFTFDEDHTHQLLHYMIEGVQSPAKLTELKHLPLWSLLQSDSQLDDKLLRLIVHDDHVSKDFHVLGVTDADESPDCVEESLLHLTASLGLTQVTGFLLTQPGGLDALMVPNSQGLMPLDIAKQQGNQALIDTLLGKNYYGISGPPWKEKLKRSLQPVYIDRHADGIATITTDMSKVSRTLEDDMKLLHNMAKVSAMHPSTTLVDNAPALPPRQRISGAEDSQRHRLYYPDYPRNVPPPPPPSSTAGPLLTSSPNPSPSPTDTSHSYTRQGKQRLPTPPSSSSDSPVKPTPNQGEAALAEDVGRTSLVDANPRQRSPIYVWDNNGKPADHATWSVSVDESRNNRNSLTSSEDGQLPGRRGSNEDKFSSRASFNIASKDYYPNLPKESRVQVISHAHSRSDPVPVEHSTTQLRTVNMDQALTDLPNRAASFSVTADKVSSRASPRHSTLPAAFDTTGSSSWSSQSSNEKVNVGKGASDITSDIERQKLSGDAGHATRTQPEWPRAAALNQVSGYSMSGDAGHRDSVTEVISGSSVNDWSSHRNLSTQSSNDEVFSRPLEVNGQTSQESKLRRIQEKRTNNAEDDSSEDDTNVSNSNRHRYRQRTTPKTGERQKKITKRAKKRNENPNDEGRQDVDPDDITLGNSLKQLENLQQTVVNFRNGSAQGVNKDNLQRYSNSCPTLRDPAEDQELPESTPTTDEAMQPSVEIVINPTRVDPDQKDDSEDLTLLRAGTSARRPSWGGMPNTPDYSQLLKMPGRSQSLSSLEGDEDDSNSDGSSSKASDTPLSAPVQPPMSLMLPKEPDSAKGQGIGHPLITVFTPGGKQRICPRHNVPYGHMCQCDEQQDDENEIGINRGNSTPALVDIRPVSPGHRVASMNPLFGKHHSVKGDDLTDNEGGASGGETPEYTTRDIRRKFSDINPFRSRRKSKGSNHNWVPLSVSNGTSCSMCSKAMANKPGLQCQNCGLKVHENCESSTGDCPSAKAPPPRDRDRHSPSPTPDGPSSGRKFAAFGARRKRSGGAEGGDEVDFTAPRFTLEELSRHEGDVWSLSVDQKSVKRLSAKEIKRQDVIWEIVQTERSHCFNVMLMQQVFYKGLEKQCDVPRETLNRIFPRLEDLLQLHLNFLSELRTRQCSHPDMYMEKIGDLLWNQFSGENAENIKSVYSEFCSSHVDAVQCYKNLQAKEKRIQVFAREISKQECYKRLDVPACILLVTQRNTKYPLLLESLLKATNATDNAEERENVIKALKGVREILDEIDSEVDCRNKDERLLYIYNKLDDKTSTVYQKKTFKKSDLLANNRRLVYTGTIKWMSARGRFTEVMVVILTDVLFFLVENNQKLHFFVQDNKPAIIGLSKLLVREKQDSRQSKGIYLLCPHKANPEMYELICNSQDDRRHWIRVFQKAAAHCFEDEGSAAIQDNARRVLEAKSAQVKELIEEIEEAELQMGRHVIAQGNRLRKLIQVFDDDLDMILPLDIQEDEELPTPDKVDILAQKAMDRAEQLMALLRRQEFYHEAASKVPVARAETFNGFPNKATATPKKRFQTMPVSPKELQPTPEQKPKSPQMQDKAGRRQSYAGMMKQSDQRSDGDAEKSEASSTDVAGDEDSHLNQLASREQSACVAELMHYVQGLAFMVSQQYSRVEILRTQLAEANEKLSHLYGDPEKKFSAFHHEKRLEELRNLQEQFRRDKETFEKTKEKQDMEIYNERKSMEKERESFNQEKAKLQDENKKLEREKTTLQKQWDLYNQQRTEVEKDMRQREEKLNKQQEMLQQHQQQQHKTAGNRDDDAPPTRPLSAGSRANLQLTASASAMDRSNSRQLPSAASVPATTLLKKVSTSSLPSKAAVAPPSAVQIIPTKLAEFSSSPSAHGAKASSSQSATGPFGPGHLNRRSTMPPQPASMLPLQLAEEKGKGDGKAKGKKEDDGKGKGKKSNDDAKGKGKKDGGGDGEIRV